jgi:transposase
MEREKPPLRRRTYSAQLKAQMVAECEAPGASVAQVARSHGVNDNILHRWRKELGPGATPKPAGSAEFIPIAVTGPTRLGSVEKDIQIQLRRNATTMTITWPMGAAAECAGWLRDLLK